MTKDQDLHGWQKKITIHKASSSSHFQNNFLPSQPDDCRLHESVSKVYGSQEVNIHKAIKPTHEGEERGLFEGKVT